LWCIRKTTWTVSLLQFPDLPIVLKDLALIIHLPIQHRMARTCLSRYCYFIPTLRLDSRVSKPIWLVLRAVCWFTLCLEFRCFFGRAPHCCSMLHSGASYASYKPAEGTIRLVPANGIATCSSRHGVFQYALCNMRLLTRLRANLSRCVLLCLHRFQLHNSRL
jgi:hypothetical protein